MYANRVQGKGFNKGALPLAKGAWLLSCLAVLALNRCDDQINEQYKNIGIAHYSLLAISCLPAHKLDLCPTHTVVRGRRDRAETKFWLQDRLPDVHQSYND